MSWPFKDSIVTVAWLSFDHTQSNIKNWLEKIKLPQKRFFLKKQLKKFSCTSSSLSLSKINKKTWEQIQSEEDNIPFLFQNDQITLNTIRFLSKNHEYNFHVSLGLFHCAKLYNSPYSWPRVVRQDVTFWVLNQNDPFAPNKNFFR